MSEEMCSKRLTVSGCFSKSFKGFGLTARKRRRVTDKPKKPSDFANGIRGDMWRLVSALEKGRIK